MSLTVIGAGFPRTGTMSLKLALEQLGSGPCHHMRELQAHPERVHHWEDAADEKPVDWNAAFAGYRSTTDAPACHFYEELAAFYPDAKVILSLRDPERWFASTQETILLPVIIKFYEPMGILNMMNKIGWGTDPRLHDKRYMIERFERHNEEVCRTIPADRLLVFEAKQGWEPLCSFLDVPVPKSPYPRTNAREDWAAGMVGPDGIKAIEAMSPDQIKKMVEDRRSKASASESAVPQR